MPGPWELEFHHDPQAQGDPWSLSHVTLRIPPDRVCVSAVTRAELMYGLKRLPPSHRLHLGVRQFLKIVRVLAWDADAADYYADIRHRLTSSRQPLGEMDMMIAAHALSIGAVLVTNNTRNFERVAPPLALVNWLED